MPLPTTTRDHSIPDQVRARLRALCDADGRADLLIARNAGMGKAQFSQLMNGTKATPSITSVARILLALHKSWADLD
jgi:transcriptional regulator with XRE-family HTH domain